MAKTVKKPLTKQGRRTEVRLPSNRARQKEIAALKDKLIDVMRASVDADRRQGRQLDELRERMAKLENLMSLLTDRTTEVAKTSLEAINLVRSETKQVDDDVEALEKKVSEVVEQATRQCLERIEELRADVFPLERRADVAGGGFDGGLPKDDAE